MQTEPNSTFERSYIQLIGFMWWKTGFSQTQTDIPIQPFFFTPPLIHRKFYFIFPFLFDVIFELN